MDIQAIRFYVNISAYEERSETIKGNNQARKATVIAMYTQSRLVVGATRTAYGPTAAATASTMNQNVGD
jgi:hypothetical protein